MMTTKFVILLQLKKELLIFYNNKLIESVPLNSQKFIYKINNLFATENKLTSSKNYKMDNINAINNTYHQDNAERNLTAFTPFLNERIIQNDSQNSKSNHKDPKKSLRELNLENMKLTEELIEQNLCQTSSIEKISNDKSRLFILLNEQKTQNKKLIQENGQLFDQMSQFIGVKKSFCLESGSKSHQIAQDSPSQIKSPYVHPFLNDNLNDHIVQNYNSSLESACSSNMRPSYNPSNTSPINQNNCCSSCCSGKVCNTAGYNIVTGKNLNNTNRNQNIILLQNHITLLEKENSLLCKEMNMTKQHEAHQMLKIKEMEIEMKNLNQMKDILMEENDELKNFLKKRTEEANDTILKLAQMNQDLNNKAKNYQTVIDKLTNEIYTLLTNGPKRDSSNNSLSIIKETGLSSTDRLSCKSTINLTPEQSFNIGSAPIHSYEIDTRKNNSAETLVLRKENFQLKADLKTIGELSQSLIKENEILLQENGKFNNLKPPLNNIENQHLTISQTLNSDNNQREVTNATDQIHFKPIKSDSLKGFASNHKSTTIMTSGESIKKFDHISSQKENKPQANVLNLSRRSSVTPLRTNKK